MTFENLLEWRKKCKNAPTIMEMKQVAAEFQAAWGLQDQKGAVLFTLLKDDWNTVVPLLMKLGIVGFKR